MYNRRKFLKHTSAAAVASFVASNAKAFSIEPKLDHAIGLQLFTLFNIIDDEVQGTLKKVADIGYKEIESAFSKKGGFYGMKPKEFAALLNNLGLSWQSHHVLGAPFKLPPGAKLPTTPDGKPITIPPMKNLRDNMQQLIDDAAEGGIPYLVCASTPIGSLDEIKNSIDVLNKTGEACKKVNIQFAYHNHDAEFRAVEGQIPYHMILSQTNADNVKMELDLAWATKGGADPVELFKAHSGRFPLWHVKDLSKDMQTIMPVGSGFIDFKRIFDNAEVAGMKHFFVEHDMPADAFASITESFNYLKKMKM
ncbi:MAG: sugar phosphate isomerase/epimerase family protein [Chitinophagaceae bacterium]